MKKRRTPKTNTIKATATKAVGAVKETAEKVTDKIAEEAPMLAENITAKTEEIMNSPIVEEGKEILKETKEKLEAVKISKYSLTNIDEFTAEAFADVEIGEKPSEYSKEVHAVITKYFGILFFYLIVKYYDK